ncbi:hypothetical protein SB48_HM08orf04188 [Heyndrickxia coagulans]|jgi:hypothetical protein|uniref:Uncharacterized protein n=1 Tax=Heyndrickxia coagulans TaxID=1398 RepID=A0AAN0T7K9_HEYCO|nr:hypothetical protein SB48_HM08orf04188 [Heyndrickxia coagulans]
MAVSRRFFVSGFIQMLRSRGKRKSFLNLEPVYVKKASKNEGLP